MTTADGSQRKFNLGDTVVQLRIDGSFDSAVTVVATKVVDGALVEVITSGFDPCFHDMIWLPDGRSTNALFRLGKLSIVHPRPEHAEAVAAYEARLESMGESM